jgi:hypothetical protein
MNHTMAPWHVKLHSGFGDDGLPVTGVWIESTEGFSIASLIPHRPVRANAHLIAAAPDLLEALREARLQLEYLDQKFSATGATAAVLARICAVIDKAEGK